MTRAALYLRISLDASGEGLAVERQRADCERIARERGWTVAGVYVDNSISASKRSVRRPAYDRMVRDYLAGSFSALITYDLDRLTRQPRQLEDWIDAAEDRGLRLVTANGEADLTTDNGRMFARIKASVARGEVERKADRQRRAAQQRASLGKVPAGVRLTGYTTTGKTKAKEAAVVLDLFERFARGETLKGLAQRLTDSGITTRSGRPWNPSTVRTMLRNPRYAGRAVYRGEVIDAPGVWSPIVSESLFDAVQARLTDPARITNRTGTDRKHLGSGLYLCGVCDGKLRTNGTRYWCPKGGHVLRSQAAVDEFVTAVLLARLARPDALEALTPTIDTAPLVRESNEIRARLDNLANLLAEGHLTAKGVQKASPPLRERLAVLQGQIAAAHGGDGITSLVTADDLAGAWGALTLAQRRDVLSRILTVHLHRVPQGRKGFDPTTVGIGWKS